MSKKKSGSERQKPVPLFGFQGFFAVDSSPICAARPPCFTLPLGPLRGFAPSREPRHLWFYNPHLPSRFSHLPASPMPLMPRSGPAPREIKFPVPICAHSNPICGPILPPSPPSVNSVPSVVKIPALAPSFVVLKKSAVITHRRNTVCPTPVLTCPRYGHGHHAQASW